MIYHWIFPLNEYFSILNVIQYITFRAGMAMLSAMILSFIAMPKFITWVQEKKMGQIIRTDGPSSHIAKTGTPAFGGVVIIASTIFTSLLWCDLTNKYVLSVLLITIGYAITGFFDDYLKFTKKNAKGLIPRYKVLGQVGFAIIPLLLLYTVFSESTLLLFPFFKNFSVNLGLFYVLFALLVIIGSSNAVNLTDGLDGLAIGTTAIICASLIVYCYLTGNYSLAEYLYYPYIQGSGELTIFCGALLGSSVAFLWFNTHPAEIFMGDVGSLAIGGAIGTVSVFIKHEILLAFIGGILVIESLSVITQVASYKMTGKRIFRMAPIHHHFELKGWPEPKVIVRFWIITGILCLIGFLSIKLR